MVEDANRDPLARLVAAGVRHAYPTWSNDAIQAEVARRMLRCEQIDLVCYTRPKH